MCRQWEENGREKVLQLCGGRTRAFLLFLGNMTMVDHLRPRNDVLVSYNNSTARETDEMLR